MSSKKNNNKPKKDIKIDKKISSFVEVKEKDNKIVYILILVIAILASLLVFFAFFNKCKTCKKCENSTVKTEVDPKYQLINYAGFRFKMPLDWDFVSEDNLYRISDKEGKIFTSFETLNYVFDSFITDEYQKEFLEYIQTSDNIKIDKTSKQDNYYLYEGSFNNYNYLIVAIGDAKKTVLIKTQFVDKVSFDKLKDDVIEFALSSIKKDEE